MTRPYQSNVTLQTHQLSLSPLSGLCFLLLLFHPSIFPNLSTISLSRYWVSGFLHVYEYICFLYTYTYKSSYTYFIFAFYHLLAGWDILRYFGEYKRGERFELEFTLVGLICFSVRQLLKLTTVLVQLLSLGVCVFLLIIELLNLQKLKRRIQKKKEEVGF